MSSEAKPQAACHKLPDGSVVHYGHGANEVCELDVPGIGKERDAKLDAELSKKR